jgi:hypothetical protein
MTGFLKAPENSIKKSGKIVNLGSFRKLVHVTINGFRKLLCDHLRLTGYHQEIVSLFIEAVLKSIIKYLRNYNVKNLKTRSGPT